MELGGPETRLQSYGFFEVVVFLVESALFLLIGLGFQEVSAPSATPTPSPSWPATRRW